MFKPKNTPQFLVYAAAADPEKSIEFYRDVFRFELIDSPAKNEITEETSTEMTQRYNNVLEELIREYPEQWFWMHNRWRLPK